MNERAIKTGSTLLVTVSLTFKESKRKNFNDSLRIILLNKLSKDIVIVQEKNDLCASIRRKVKVLVYAEMLLRREQ